MVGLNLDLLFVLHHVQQPGSYCDCSLQVEEPVHTSWSTFYTVNHRASAGNYQLSKMKCPDRYSNSRPQRLKVSNLTTTSPTPLDGLETSSWSQVGNTL